MKRRQFLLWLGAIGLAGAGFRYWPEDGLWNPCPSAPLPQALRDDPLVRAAWEGAAGEEFAGDGHGVSSRWRV